MSRTETDIKPYKINENNNPGRIKTSSISAASLKTMKQRNWSSCLSLVLYVLCCVLVMMVLVSLLSQR